MMSMIAVNATPIIRQNMSVHVRYYTLIIKRNYWLQGAERYCHRSSRVGEVGIFFMYSSEEICFNYNLRIHSFRSELVFINFYLFFKQK